MITALLAATAVLAVTWTIAPTTEITWREGDVLVRSNTEWMVEVDGVLFEGGPTELTVIARPSDL